VKLCADKLELNHAEGRWSCRIDGRELEVDAVLVWPEVLSLRIGNSAYEVKSEKLAGDSYVAVDGVHFATEIRDPRSLRGRSRLADDQGPRKIVAPMPGKVVRILVREGDDVIPGAGVVVVEAMKMQNEIKSSKKGKIQKIAVAEGAPVNAGDVLAIVE
jgi:biotin carboxyl carrier protein